MSDPRDAVRYDGIKQVRATYPIDASTITYEATVAGGSSHIGKAVTINTSEVVALCADAEHVAGRLEKVEADGYAVVTVKGYVKLPGGDGAVLTNGKSIVGDLGAAGAKGFIREVATAQAAELGVANGTIIDPSTATAVVVLL